MSKPYPDCAPKPFPTIKLDARHPEELWRTFEYPEPGSFEPVPLTIDGFYEYLEKCRTEYYASLVRREPPREG